jgi:hypothetical protein
VSWDAVAPQFPHDDMALSDAEMAERLPDGIRLPLDEVIRQVLPDCSPAAGPAADVRGLEELPALPAAPVGSAPSRSQPRRSLTLEPIHTAPGADAALIGLEEPGETISQVAEEAAPVVVAPAEPEIVTVPEPVLERAPEPVAAAEVVNPIDEQVEPDFAGGGAGQGGR